ncbi:MAG: succinyl-diaminopimelate desuccinylase [Pseudomonadota bacterium]
MIDPVDLTAALIRCESVTPAEGGAITLLEETLGPIGFELHRCDRNGIANLFARTPGDGPVFGFAGHTDVVPPGDADAWTYPPFSAAQAEDQLWGRGAVDMKSGVAAFIAAAAAYRAEGGEGSIALLITGDEEGQAKDGTVAILDWMKSTDQRLDHCIVGEPTSPNQLGDMIKIGRRGSMTARFTATGRQGHTAYPHRAANPLPPLIAFLGQIASHNLDDGTEHFDPSTLALTTVDVGNPANNVIPASAKATCNIRFNDAHSSKKLALWLLEEATKATQGTEVRIETEFHISGESFLTAPGLLTDILSEAIAAETGLTPELSTSGGTSDARFIKDICPVAEFGLVGKTMHQIDERAPVEEIRSLANIYKGVLEKYFATLG